MKKEDIKKQIVITGIPFPKSDEGEFYWKEEYTLETGDDGIPSVSISGGEYKPQPKDKLYFYAGCDIPRHKVRSWAKANDAAVTIKQSNGTAFFGSSESLRMCFNEEITVRVRREKFIDWLKDNYKEDHSNISELYEELDNSTENFVFLGNSYIGYRGRIFTGTTGRDYRTKVLNNDSEWKPHFKSPLRSFDPDMDVYNYINVVRERKLDDAKALLDDPVIYTQESLIGLINKEAVVIDQDMYNYLRTMFKSSNTEDQALALEIIANCNITPSIHHVLLLLREFCYQMGRLKQSNHVNFKSLLEFLGLADSWYNIDDEVIMEILMSKNVLTYDMLKEFAEGMKTTWNEATQNKYFKISKIEVTDEVKQYFEKQKTVKQPDEVVEQ